mmetsp:Transcript_3370/g.6177  ORF Transcript_3370/g.6177 Transcript_3370/m.6177 type:complete len:83 (-) Transcript_3370:69-317(-)
MAMAENEPAELNNITNTSAVNGTVTPCVGVLHSDFTTVPYSCGRHSATQERLLSCSASLSSTSSSLRGGAGGYGCCCHYQRG